MGRDIVIIKQIQWFMNDKVLKKKKKIKYITGINLAW